MNKRISQFDKDCRDFALYLDSISPMRWRCGTYDHRKGCVKRLPIGVQLRIVHDKLVRYDNMILLNESDMSNKHKHLVNKLRFILNSNGVRDFKYYNGICFIFPCAPSVFCSQPILFKTLKKFLLWI